MFCSKTRKHDKVHVAPRTLVKAVLSVSSTGCNNKRQSLAKLSYRAIDNNKIQYNTKFVKRHVGVASEALANRTVKKHRRRRTNVL